MFDSKSVGKQAVQAGVFLTLLTLGTSVARADTLFGTFNINSNDQITDTVTSTGITFNKNGTPIAPNDGSLVSGVGYVANRTGDFMTLLSFGQNVLFKNPILWDTGAGELLFDTGSNNGHDITFTATSSNPTPDASNSYTFYGYLADNGTNRTDGRFTITNVESGANVSFTSVAKTTATPEPMSLSLLGTGLVGIAGMAFRRRTTSVRA